MATQIVSQAMTSPLESVADSTPSMPPLADAIVCPQRIAIPAGLYLGDQLGAALRRIAHFDQP